MCFGSACRDLVAFDEAESGRAKVSLSGVERMISTDLLMDEDVKIGDWVLVHVGFAMSKIDAAEAATTLDQIKKLGQFESELEQFKTTSAD
ncbi:HypC/HybG/HupF family hydrogenase formation chaperone [Mobiluncus curtisii]|uniref:Hydrogenase isoenzymes formation protein hypC n=1 Tax=Mobiluncus curtisii TaxID=2051 RepID=A0A2X3BRG4_9ACTO|nr:HypC/HybG/HupF family hydrogenase formation chaperone [Mobiluncus curtisii]SQC02374.1 Hydrogenase isoenzymes formation protein hypC [Mobiluncus curtisii]